MDKKRLLNRINEEDRIIFSSIIDKIQLCEKTNKNIYSNEFYAPNIWKEIENMSHEFSAKILSNGIFEEAERRMLCFTYSDVVSYPVFMLKISNKSNFHKLEHKDYLGAMMSLGIKREKFGDFIVIENSCYIATCEDIYDFVIYNLSNIGKCPCTVEVLKDVSGINMDLRFQTYIINSTSYRVDCIIGAICNVSRSKAEDFIKQGKVLLNYSAVSEKDKNVDVGTVITIRGFGKFKVAENIGNTAKGRCKILIKKYI